MLIIRFVAYIIILPPSPQHKNHIKQQQKKNSVTVLALSREQVTPEVTKQGLKCLEVWPYICVALPEYFHKITSFDF